jgi:hypothetical protein
MNGHDVTVWTRFAITAVSTDAEVKGNGRINPSKKAGDLSLAIFAG